MTILIVVGYLLMGIATASAFFQQGSWHQSRTSAGEVCFMISLWWVLWIMLGTLGACAFAAHVVRGIRDVCQGQ